MQSIHEEILNLIKTCDDSTLASELSNYHAADIADVFQTLTAEERKRVYDLLDTAFIAEIMSFYDDVEDYVEEFSPEETADIIEEMDTDDAVELLNELDEEDKEEILELLEEEVKEAIEEVDKYDEDLVGSYMSDNFITVHESDSIKKAMNSMVSQAGDHDNIFTLFVVNDNEEYLGVIYLKDLIVSRKEVELSSLIMSSYPSFYDDQIMSECINKMKDYEENMFPVISRDNKLLGVITSDSIVEAVEEEMEEDYVKLGGLSESEELDESVGSSIKKRIPWLIFLLALSLIVSSVIGTFENVIDGLPVIVFFQSMILGMSGNVGTQSLAVTIRNLTDDSFISDRKKQARSLWKELRIGFVNGLIIGGVSLLFVFVYLLIVRPEIVPGNGFVYTDALMVASITSGSMLVAITTASLIGALFPIILTKMKIDPAVASGPFITTMNDIVSVLIYYGLTSLIFFVILQIG